MKEIDFIPEWYKTGQKRMVSYQRQYALLGCLFAVLLIWSFAAGGLLSHARGQINERRQVLEMAEPLTEEYEKTRGRIAVLEEKAEILERISPRTDIPQILAELSYLVGDRIVLSNLKMQNEPLISEAGSSRADAVRVVRTGKSDNGPLPQANTITRVALTGIAAEASDVAELISKLEESPYFFRVMPGYSRNNKVRQWAVTEFEIGCCVANYVENGEGERQ
jgi:hypothetical protein